MEQRYEKFINKSIVRHDDYYDYSLVEYKNAKTPINIICPKHGQFKQTPDNHTRGRGCQICGGSKKLTNDEFIKKAINKHGDMYNYSLTEYVNNQTKVKIICPKHGEFEQIANDHLKYGCNKCGILRVSIKKSLTNDEFIKKATDKHGDYYDYSNVDYCGHRQKVKIICPKHGMFIQKVNGHLNGQGCPICRESRGEREIRVYLEINNINFIPQYKFNDCRNVRPLPFDFYLPDYNTCIEYDGEQHYRLQENSLFGGENEFKHRKLHDSIKNNYCSGVNGRPKLIRIPYTKFNEIPNILSFIIS